MKHLTTEASPRARLRLHLSSVVHPGDLKRVGLVHVMHQRRLFERLNEQLSNSNRPKPPLQALSLQTIRAWLGEDVHFDAVERDASVQLINLDDLLSAPDREFDGVELVQTDSRSYADVEFYGAAFGDDIGIVSSSANEGDFAIRPKDPGGAPHFRLFRVASDRLVPLSVDGKDELFRTIVRDAARAVARRGSERAQASASGQRWAEFAQRLGLAAGTEQLAGSLPTPIAALMLVAWSEIAQQGTGTAAAGAQDFQSFRRAPGLAAALHRFPDMISRDAAAGSNPDVALPYQVAAAVGAVDLVPARASADAWTNIWRALADPEIVRGLVAARISLDGSFTDLRAIRDIARVMRDRRRVDDAVELYTDREEGENAAALQEYLDRRSRDSWSTLAAASRLAGLVLSGEADDPEPVPPTPTAMPDTRTLAAILADVEQLLAAAAKASPPPPWLGAAAADLAARRGARNSIAGFYAPSSRSCGNSRRAPTR